MQNLHWKTAPISWARRACRYHEDLIVDTIGAAVISVVGYISLKYKMGWVEKLLLAIRKH
jgi:hypothetical protein